jgi:tRNA (guanine37-N1)-methyltransferase
MTKFIVLTLFPEIFEKFTQTSIIKRAIDSNLVQIDLVDIRDFSNDKNRKVDDTPYGGGNGMVIRCEPLDSAIQFAIERVGSNPKIIYLSPRGKLLEYSLVDKLSTDNNEYILICGHYEGIDERIKKNIA